ncbi:MAG TPA: UDP-glucose/GDP-mannose dehydrogenase family protein [Patescibacteria group bacterium]|nr:UDP-glucose/GDP-mannose dehydrogenase family protein [Patescibacteria group bacterium]
MKVIIIGTGYVGLVQGVCLAELGNEVVCIDLVEEKIVKLQQGISPIYEPGIEELITRNLKAGRIKFSTSLAENIDDAEIIFIAVGTPPDEDGRADLKYVLAAAQNIGKNLKKYAIIVNKSTVPIGTGQMVRKMIAKYFSGEFDVVSNPEFLREGSAIDDWMKPDRVVIGGSNGQKAAKKVGKLYEVLGAPILITNLEAAEMIKYASNSYLATQISFINSIAQICEKVGADVTQVSRGMKLDKRIGERASLNAGLGYGGSCFPKDVEALVQIAQDNDVPFKILEEVEVVNKLVCLKFVEKITKTLTHSTSSGRAESLKGKKIAVCGIAFKPKTDDIRMAQSVTIIEQLETLGAEVVAFDPVAAANLLKIMPEVKFVDNAADACKDADALVIVTEWDEFKQIDLTKIKTLMKKPNIFDGRNIYDPAEMTERGFNYISIGR